MHAVPGQTDWSLDLNLAPGARLGPYEITAAIGAGGMGEVWRATDTRLGRHVALKLLPAAFATDPDRLSRFEREAKLLASLNHSSIAHLYGFEQATLPGGGNAHLLAMELVEGEDLAERLKRGPIPGDEAVAIARQIAEALEEAHEKGIVHRDLKPANVKLAADGRVKVLDFGLAKAWSPTNDPRSGSVPAPSQSPTLAHTGTAAGLILGTAAYMSPEQARGKPVDRRADIWSFGVVLFEMLTGRRLFEGETVSDVLAAVLTRHPDYAALPATTPAGVRSLLQRCLERDPKLRLRDIGEATIALGKTALDAEAVAAPAAATRPRTRGVAALLAVALAAGGAGALAARASLPAPATLPVVRLTHSLPTGPTSALGALNVSALALSPDGARLAYASNERIYVRSLDSLEALEVPGTGRGSNPFFSPDGSWLGFSAGGSLRKTSLAGGTPVTLPAPEGTASWAEDGTILVGAGYAGVLRVPADGGALQSLVAPEPPWAYLNPQLLPGGRTFLYTRSDPGDDTRAETVACSLDGRDCTQVLTGARSARYLRTGHLLFAAATGVMAVPFDLASRRTTGPPVLVEGVSGLNVYSQYFFDVSASGTLAYASAASDTRPTRLSIVAGAGRATAVPGAVRYFSDPRISPEGRRAAVHIQDEENDVWVADLSRGTLLRLSTAPGEDETPAWSPDGRFVAWTGSRPDVARGVFRRPADGSGSEELLFTTDLHLHVNDWSADGKTLVLHLQDPKTGADLHTLDLASGKANVFLQSRFQEHSARLSPSARHVAYVSDESGRNEVYVQTFPEPGGKLRVTAEGGEQPLWSRDGRSIFFRGQRSVWAARFDPGPPASVSVPEVLFPDHFESPQAGTHTGYDVLPDGRFLMAEPTESPSGEAARRSEIVFVLNFVQNMNAGTPAR